MRQGRPPASGMQRGRGGGAETTAGLGSYLGGRVGLSRVALGRGGGPWRSRRQVSDAALLTGGGRLVYPSMPDSVASERRDAKMGANARAPAPAASWGGGNRRLHPRRSAAPRAAARVG